MKFSHTEDKREGQHLGVFEPTEENGLRIVVSRLGAELVSVARMNEEGDWVGFSLPRQQRRLHEAGRTMRQ